MNFNPLRRLVVTDLFHSPDAVAVLCWNARNSNSEAWRPPLHGLDRSTGTYLYTTRNKKRPESHAASSLRARLAESYWRRCLSETARAVKDARLTYLSAAKLYRIERCLSEIDKARVEGDCVEFGVALGGSGVLIAKRMAGSRSFVGYDLFGTIPPPSDRDSLESHERYRVIASGRSSGIGGDTYYGYESNLFEKVKGSFTEFGVPVDDARVRLVKGLFEETVSFDNNVRIAFAHVDCDWYDPVALCLDRPASPRIFRLRPDSSTRRRSRAAPAPA